ncbi:MAG TPA: glycoside hydrolase family 2 protein, partial [Bacteroidia bacterium]|nr:glycoside hydrolase family 2 protein [Bacteroidia bacterium]
AIEAHRRAKPYCMGTLYWQLNDCWPVTSWSSVDYYGNWKALHYQVKRSFNEVILSIEEKNDSIYVYVINDKPTDITGELTMSINLFSGPDYMTDAQLRNINVKANSSKVYLKYSKEKFRDFDPRTFELSVCLYSGKEIYSNSYCFEKPKNLILFDPKINFKILDKNTIIIHNQMPAKGVYLSLPNATFSDNYFDMLNTGGEKKIQVNYSEEIDLNKIEIKSLFNVN